MRTLSINFIFLIALQLSMTPAHALLGVQDWRYRWPDMRIPYVIDKNLDSDAKKRFYQAKSYWETVTAFRFVEKTAQDKMYWVYVTNANSEMSGTEGRAHTGRRWDCEEHRKDKKLVPPKFTACISYLLLGDNIEFGTTVHELGHVVGLLHEHTRLDRNNYVNIVWDNVKTGKDDNFVMWPANPEHGASGGESWGPYDVNSIMHYGSYVFSGAGPFSPYLGATIWSYQIGEISGDRKALSANDLKYVKALYSPLCDGFLEGDTFGTLGMGSVISSLAIKNCAERKFYHDTNDYYDVTLKVSSLNYDKLSGVHPVSGKDEGDFFHALYSSTDTDNLSTTFQTEPNSDYTDSSDSHLTLPGRHYVTLTNLKHSPVRVKVEIDKKLATIKEDEFERALGDRNGKNNSFSYATELDVFADTTTYPYPWDTFLKDAEEDYDDLTLHQKGDVDFYKVRFLKDSDPKSCDRSGSTGAIPATIQIRLNRKDMGRKIKITAYSDKQAFIASQVFKGTATDSLDWKKRSLQIRCPEQVSSDYIFIKVEDLANQRNIYSLNFDYDHTRYPPKDLPPLEYELGEFESEMDRFHEEQFDIEEIIGDCGPGPIDEEIVSEFEIQNELGAEQMEMGADVLNWETEPLGGAEPFLEDLIF